MEDGTIGKFKQRKYMSLVLVDEVSIVLDVSCSQDSRDFGARLLLVNLDGHGEFYVHHHSSSLKPGPSPNIGWIT